jgi:hypothetical protein
MSVSDFMTGPAILGAGRERVHGQPVEHQRGRQVPVEGLAVEVGALFPGELDDLLLARDDVVDLLGLAGVELLILRVEDQHRRSDPTDHVTDLVFLHLFEQVVRVFRPVGLTPGCRCRAVHQWARRTSRLGPAGLFWRGEV